MKHLLLPLFFISWCLLGAQPAWFNAQNSQTGEIVGKGVAKIVNKDEAEARSAATADAIADISRQIYSEVRAYTQNHETEGFENTQFYVRDVQIQSGVNLSGAKTVNAAAEKGYFYVVQSVKRENLIRNYMQSVKQAADDAILMFGDLQANAAQNPKEVLRRLTNLRALLDDLARDARILNSLYAAGLENIVPELARIPRIMEVDKQIAELKGNPRQSYADLAEELLGNLKPELRQARRYSLSHFEWLNTGFASEFSVNFSQYLATELEKRYAWSPAEGLVKPELTLSGQMIGEADRVNLIVRFTGSHPQTLSVVITPATIAHFGWDNIRPTDLDAKLEERKLLLDESVQDNRLRVEAKFMEFSGPAVFRVGDPANIYLRANKSCYITVINVEANGDRNVLIQNQRIPASSAWEWVSLDGEFEVVEPTGIEQILLRADVVPIPEMEVKAYAVPGGGSKYIATGLNRELALTRGLKKKEPQSEYTESYLTWTVLPRR